MTCNTIVSCPLYTCNFDAHIISTELYTGSDVLLSVFLIGKTQVALTCSCASVKEFLISCQNFAII